MYEILGFFLLHNFRMIKYKSNPREFSLIDIDNA